jgi:hypothetical protein
VKSAKNAKIEKTAVLQPQYEQVGQLWRSCGCWLPTQPKLPLKCRGLVLSPQTTLPELPEPQNHAKTSRPILPDPKKCPEKSLRPRSPFSKLKARSRIKRNLNKLGCKREAYGRRSNPLDPESMSSSASQETALRPLLIFRYRRATQKIAAGVALKF